MSAKGSKDTLMYEKKHVYDVLTDEEKRLSFAYAEGYKKFLDAAKTEREAVGYSVATAERKGYVPYRFGMKLASGGKYYYNNRGKELFLFRIGSDSLENGMFIAAAHIDAPKIDIKQNPVYEESGFGLLKTHYYGGIKKYQWTTVPLSLHGVIIKKNGESVEIRVGEDEDDPQFYISDLPAHFAKTQMDKKMSEAVTGESMNVIVGTDPCAEDGSDTPIKRNIIRLLNEKYGITEEDFFSAELTAVPAYRARDIGFDRSVISGYGHDDRACVYPILTALLDSESTEKTVMVVLADKEETGSAGTTGMQNRVFADLMDEIAEKMNVNPRLMKANSRCISADVNGAYDPNYPDIGDTRNSAYINCGLGVSKYNGSGGKFDASEASAEFVGWLRGVFDENGIVWQTAEFGKVDQGGGGTVAKFITGQNIETVDVGVPVVSMHAPCELVSKNDLYMAYKAFCVLMN